MLPSAWDIIKNKKIKTTFTESITHGAIWCVPLPSAVAAGFMVKILRIWQDANKEMASSVEMPLNNSPASDSRSMNSMAHWGEMDSRILRLQGWLNNTANGLRRAIWKGHLKIVQSESWFSYNHAHVVFQASERDLCMKQVHRKSFINCWKVQSFFLFISVRYPLKRGKDMHKYYIRCQLKFKKSQQDEWQYLYLKDTLKQTRDKLKDVLTRVP